MTKALTLACVALISALGLCARGERSETVGVSSAKPLTLMLDWFPNADHVGIYQGLAEGDFRAAGIDLHVQVPPSASTPLQLLAAGQADLAISYEPDVMIARDA